MQKSWRTTTWGVFCLLAAVGIAGKAVFDTDPETIVNIQELIAAVIAGLTGMGLLSARDDKKEV